MLESLFIAPLSSECAFATSNAITATSCSAVHIPLLGATLSYLVLADFIDVALVLALPGQIKVVKAALVERDEQVDAVVAKVDGHAGAHHLLRKRA